MTADLKCLEWNNSEFEPCKNLDKTKYTLALNPMCWLKVETFGLPIKVSYLGQTNRLASLDNRNHILVYDWCKAVIKNFTFPFPSDTQLTNLTSNSVGNQIATCADNGKIQLWNYKHSDWKISREFKGHHQSVRSIEYSTDNKYLVTCSNDKTFKIWDSYQPNKFLASNMFHRNWVNMAKFFRGDKIIVSCSRDSYVQVFDLCSGKIVAKYNLRPDYAETLSLKDDFSIAVGTNQGSVQVFDLRCLKVLQKYCKHKSQINCVQYQHNTPCLVSVSDDKQLNVFDTSESRFLYSINHLNKITSMDISSDDKLLATTSFHFGNEVTLWKTEKMEFC